MPVLSGLTVKAKVNWLDPVEAVHSPDIGRASVGVGLSVDSGDRVGVDIGASSSTHPANITTATIANMAIKPALLFLFIITSPFYFYFL